MSLLLEAMTSSNDKEISENLMMVRNVSRLGLVHESINVIRPTAYTRESFPFSRRSTVTRNKAHRMTGSWFAWANSVFAQTILDLARRKPHLLFGEGAEPYDIEA